MSIKVMEFAWTCSQAKGIDRFVLLAIANYADDNGLAWPSISRLVQRTSLNRMTIIRSLQSLETLGVLQIEQTRGKGNRYTILTSHSLRPVTHSDQSLSATPPVTHSDQHQSLTVTPHYEPSLEPSNNRHAEKKLFLLEAELGKPSEDPVLANARKIWNEQKHPNQPKLTRPVTGSRQKFLSRFLTEARSMETFARAVAAFAASDDVNGTRRGSKARSIDTMLRDEHRAKWIDAADQPAPVTVPAYREFNPEEQL